MFKLTLMSLIAATPIAAAEITVTMKGRQYTPAAITAAVGDTLRFVNDGAADHNVLVVTSGHALDLGKQEPGQQTTMTLHRAGSFEVECVFHDNMLLNVEVKG